MRNKFQIIMLLASVVCFWGTLGLAWFFYNLTMDKYSEVETIHAAWRVEEKRRSDVKHTERVLEEIQEERVELDTHFARSLDVVPLLDNLERTGTLVGAQAEVISVDRLEQGQSLSIGLRASGNWSALYKFILLLENSPYELEFSALDIKKAFTGEDATEATWEASFKIKVISFLP